jgi:hypothetical protein
MTKRKPTERRRPTGDAERSAVEACQLLGLGRDPSRLGASDRLKVDLVSTLRLVIDHAGEAVLDGGVTDLGRLVTAVEHLTKLLPARQLEPPVQTRSDPREALLRMFMQMKERGEIDETKVATNQALRAENKRLRAEIAALKAAAPARPLPGTPDDVPTMVERVPAPAGGNVVPLPRPSASAPAAPAYDYDRERGWRDFIEPTGEIRSTPRGPGKYWGPV